MTDLEPAPTQALQRIEQNQFAVHQPLSVSEITQRLEFVKQVMASAMVEGQDFGKIPGCGNKPSLFQPGAQKLSLTFQLNTALLTEKVMDLANYHREYSIVVRVSSPGGKFADGVGVCSTLEAKYRYRSGERVCPKCSKPTIITGKAEYGGGFICFSKKGGCGAKFAENDKAITDQQTGRVEHDNPADFWNTVRKMAFKRAFVHATINFTNTSELWSQDLEDMADIAANASETHPEKPAPQKSQPPAQTASRAAQTPRQATSAPKPATTEDVLPKTATLATRNFAMKELGLLYSLEDIGNFLKAKGWLDGTNQWNLPNVPTSREAIAKIAAEIGKWLGGEELPSEDEDALPPEIANVVITVPRKGMKRADYMQSPDTIGSLRELGKTDEYCRGRLWGLCANWMPSGYNGNPPPKEDIACREGLDAYMEWRDARDSEMGNTP